MKKIIVLFVALIMLFGCKENSALSDVELTNPKLISPEITLSKHVNEFGRSETGLVVYLNDKNNNSIDLLKGGIALNKTPLGVHSEMGGAPYYTLSNLELIPKTKYSFQITLADDKSYSCLVTSPKQLIGGFSVPEYHNVNKPLTVSWDKFNAGKRFNCVLEISSDEGFKKEIGLSSRDLRNGMYVIGSNIMNEINNDERSDYVIALKFSNSGKVDPKFDGGSIKIIQSISKQITIDEGGSEMDDESDGVVSAYNHKKTVEEAKKEGQNHSSGISWLKLFLTGVGGIVLGCFVVVFLNKRKAKK